jgi:fructokinase
MNKKHLRHRNKTCAKSDPDNLLLSASPTNPAVVGTGLISLDVVVGAQQGATPRYWAGGTCGNVLAILAYLGWRSYPAATLGKDIAADMVIEDFARFDMQLQFLTRDTARHTPIIVEKIRIRPDGTPRHRFVWTCPTCGAWLPGYRTLLASQAAAVAQKMPDAKVFFFDRISRGALALARASVARGALVVFEPNGIKDGRLFQEALQVSHIIKYSRERVGPLRVLDKCEGRKLEIETLGDEGLRYRVVEGQKKSLGSKELGPYPISDFKDAAGAGDWCTAGIIHCLGRHGAVGFNRANLKQIKEALNVGQALAAIKCRFEGPRGIMYYLKKDQLEVAFRKTLDGGPLPTLSDDLTSPEVQQSLKAICPRCPKIAKRTRGLAKKTVGR